MTTRTRNGAYFFFPWYPLLTMVTRWRDRARRTFFSYRRHHLDNVTLASDSLQLSGRMLLTRAKEKEARSSPSGNGALRGNPRLAKKEKKFVLSLTQPRAGGREEARRIGRLVASSSCSKTSSVGSERPTGHELLVRLPLDTLSCVVRERLD